MIENKGHGLRRAALLFVIWCASWSGSLAASAGQSEGALPEVTQVKPAQVARGSHVTLEVKGKNFAPGVRVSFSNPGIHVQRVSGSGHSLKVEIEVAADAEPGSSGLFVINPDESETEASLEVISESVTASSAPASAPSSASASAGSGHQGGGEAGTSHGQKKGQQFEVYNLGEVAAMIQTRNAVKGILSLTKQTLTYEENGQQIFSVKLQDIREVAVNSMLGVNTGTFHIILASGKRYNFVAASLRPADGQAIVDSLRRALP